ncbi:hypothetical protein BX666DRAFT_1315383 [Dichotomocladium elegans]|nr:hypothetical protein BX666DRAFT_1315383 [Dichotomocladium elegans]
MIRSFIFPSGHRKPAGLSSSLLLLEHIYAGALYFSSLKVPSILVDSVYIYICVCVCVLYPYACPWVNAFNTASMGSQQRKFLWEYHCSLIRQCT